MNEQRFVRLLGLVARLSLVSCGGPNPEADVDAGREAGPHASAAVDATTEPPDAGPPGLLNAAEIEALSATYATFSRMNARVFRTQQHDGNADVNVYANASAVESFRQIGEGEPPADFAFPPGSMLVKEMLDANGGAPVLTVMYKQAAGVDDRANEARWWYGRLHSDGRPTRPEFAGQVDFCIGCHSGSPGWDRVWGVPEAGR